MILITLDTLEQRYLVGIDGGGIGAVAVHPARTFLAVAEKKPSGNPAVYIYEFPSLRLVRVLREGTERAYSAVQFNEKGDLLATVGSYPDYMLTIWDWRNEGTILRSKAFSQEVFNVTFSNYFDGHLITSGTGTSCFLIFALFCFACHVHAFLRLPTYLVVEPPILTQSFTEAYCSKLK